MLRTVLQQEQKETLRLNSRYVRKAWSKGYESGR